MKTLGIIPARWASSRFPGKPLADICGKPMVWWVYQSAIQSKIDKIIVATDDERISKTLIRLNIPYIMTQQHKSAICRVREVASKFIADFYVQINGDEPLIKPSTINKILLKYIPQDKEFGANLICKIKNPVELNDTSNIKVVSTRDNQTIYMSRNPIPSPYNNLDFSYYKHIGILGFNKRMLDFFAQSEPLELESIEGLETLRFIEYKKIFLSIKVANHLGLSVDTPKDLEYIKNILMKGKIQ